MLQGQLQDISTYISVCHTVLKHVIVSKMRNIFTMLYSWLHFRILIYSGIIMKAFEKIDLLPSKIEVEMQMYSDWHGWHWAQYIVRNS